jgi:hypothetical protein
MVIIVFSSSCCVFRVGLPLDSRFRGNDDEGQGGWHEGLLRKIPSIGGVDVRFGGRTGWVPFRESFPELKPTPGLSSSVEGCRLPLHGQIHFQLALRLEGGGPLTPRHETFAMDLWGKGLDMMAPLVALISNNSCAAKISSMIKPCDGSMDL